MTARAILSFALATCLMMAPLFAEAAVSLPELPGVAPKLTIYLAKGEANSCGPGCDSWIAIEGRVDLDAASRVRQFLRGIKDTQRPFYFHSPGGDVRQALAIGRLLRVRKAIGRVGRTVATGCAAEAQAEGACLKIKTAGGEIAAGLATRGAMCNSACAYLLLGATTREIAPDAAMGVHNSKLIVEFRGHPSARQRAEFIANRRDRADRDSSAYVAAMGISHELIELIRTVKFENVHMLTRPELYRFRIDVRPLAETAWTLEAGAHPFIRKIASAKKDDDTFRTMEWRLFCENKDRARLLFIREFDKAVAGASSVALTAGAEKPPLFGAFPSRQGGYEIWSAVIAADAVKILYAPPRLEVGESTSMPDGKATKATFEIETRGFETAWTQLSATCAPPPSSAQPRIEELGVAKAPAL